MVLGILQNIPTTPQTLSKSKILNNFMYLDITGIVIVANI